MIPTSSQLMNRSAANALLARDDRRRRDAVWKDSRRAPKIFSPMTRRERDALWYRVRRRFHDRGDWKLKWVLHALLFDFLNMRDGRLDPSWEAIARSIGCSVSSVYRGLKALKKKAIITWDRHCDGTMIDKRYVLEQDTNAYRIDARWGETIAPAPEPESWGKTPPLPSALELAKTETSADAIAKALATDPNDKLAALALRLKPKL